jgi:hypothetical protein
MTNSNPNRIFVPIERESPAGRQHLHTLTAGALLPFIQAGMTGIITCLVIAIVFSSLRFKSPWSWGGTIGAIAWGLTWLSLQRHWFSLTSLEQITGLDLNKDGSIGKPPENNAHIPDRFVQVRLSDSPSNGNLHIVNFSLPASAEQMNKFAEGLHSGTTLSERNWTGPGRPFSIEQFRRLRIELQKRGLVTPNSDKDGRQGFILTESGEAFILEYLSPT